MTLNPSTRSDSRRAKTERLVKRKAKYSLVTEGRLGRLLMDEMEEIYRDEVGWRDPAVKGERATEKQTGAGHVAGAPWGRERLATGLTAAGQSSVIK